MRRNRGECFLVTCATLGCLFVVASCCAIGAWFYFHKKASEVRPMVHQTPARTVELNPPVSTGGRPERPEDPPASLLTNSPTPAPQYTPSYEELPATISADGLMVGMTRAATAPSKTHIFQGNTLAEIREAHSLTVNAQQWQAGQKADLAALRKALPTRRESQKSERDGSIRHSFPQTGLEVQVWIRNGHYQRFALLKAL